MADWAQQQHPHLAAAQAAAHNLVNCVDRTLRAGHSLREESHGIAKEAQQLLQDLESKAQACSGMSQAAVAQAGARIAAALDTLRLRVTELQQQQGAGGLIIARLTRPGREKIFLQEARSQLQGARSFIREEHQRAKEAATAATAPAPLQAASAAQQQQQQLAGATSAAAPGGTPFANTPLQPAGTIALVPMVQHGGSASSSDCVLWLCSNKKVEFVPSWAPTAGRTELAVQGKARAVTCVIADNRSGQIWTGHADGSVQLHLPNNWCCASLPPAADAYGAAIPGSPVCSMALDCPLPHSRRCCWVGDEAGSIRVVTHDPGSSRLVTRFEDRPGAAAAAVINRSAGAAAGAPVRALLGFEGLMISAGGSWLHELCAWDARSCERVEQHNCQGIGAATCLVLLPWSCDSGAADDYSGTSSSGSAAYDCWRLLSGHDSGQLALWQMRPRPVSALGPRVLQQLVLIDTLPKSAIRGIAVVASISMLVLAQEPSWLSVLPFPSATNGALPPGSAAASKPSNKAAGAGSAMPGLALGVPASSLGGAGASAGLMVAAHRWSPKVARIKAHSRSLIAFASLGELIITASGKSVKPWTAEHLRLEAQGDGVIISRPSEQLRQATGGSGSSSRLGSAKSLALSAADSSTLQAVGSSAAARQASLDAAQHLQHLPPPQQLQRSPPPVGWLLAQSKLLQQQQQQQPPTMFGQVSASPKRDQPQVFPSVGSVAQQQQQQQQQGTHLQQLTSAVPAQQLMLQQLGPQLAELSQQLQPQPQPQQPQPQQLMQQQQAQLQPPPHLIKPDSHPGEAWRDPTAVMPRQQTLQQTLQQPLQQAFQVQPKVLQPLPQPQPRDRSLMLGVQAHHIISKSELTKKKEIGMGAEGKVYWASWMNIDVAAKEYLLESSAGDSQQSKQEAVQRAADALQREAELLTSLNHPNLVRFCGVCLDPPLLVMELYRHGNVWTMLHKARRQWEQPRPVRDHKQATSGAANKYMAYFTWDRRLEMLHNVAAGMVYLHKRCYVHGDLRSPNLFVGSDGQVKIGDFGFTKLLSSEGGRLQVKRITHPRWVAPELLRDGSLSAACDVYSFGMIMVEMLTWKKPFSAVEDEQQVVADVLNGLRPEVPAQSHVPQGPASSHGLVSYTRLMQQCYAQAPAERPTFASIASRLKAMLHWRMIIRAQRLKSDAWLKLLHRAQADDAARRQQQLQAGTEAQQPSTQAKDAAAAAALAAGRKALWTTSGVGDASFSSTRSALIGTAMGPGNLEQCPTQPSSLGYFSSAAGGHHEQPSSSGSTFSDGLASSSLSATALSRINLPSFSNRSQPGSSSADLPTPMPSGSRGPNPALQYSSSSRSSSGSRSSGLPTIWGSAAGVSPWQAQQQQQQQQQQLSAGGDPTLQRLSAAAAAMASLPAAAGSGLEPALSTVPEVPAAEHDREEQARRDLEAFNQLDQHRHSQHSSPVRPAAHQQAPPAAEAQAPAAAFPAPAVAAAATESLLAGLRPDLRRLAIDGSELVIKQELEQASITTGNVLHGSVFLGAWCGIDIAAKQFMAPQDCGACSSSAPIADVCARAKATLVQVLPVLSGLNHPNVVRLFGVCLEPPLDCSSLLPLVITEFYRHGSVWKMLQQARQQYLQPPGAATDAASSTSGTQATKFKYQQYLSWQRRLEMLQDVAAGLSYLGKAGYDHTGLRSSRLYVNSAGRVKVGGLAALCGPDAAATVASGSAVSQFGALMFEVLTWQAASQEALQAVAAGKQELAIPRITAAAAQQRLLQHSSGNTAAAADNRLAAAGLASLAGNAAAAGGVAAYVQLLRDCLGSSSTGAQHQQLTFEDVSGRLTAILQHSAAAAAAPRGSSGGTAAAAAAKKLASSAAAAAAAGRLTPAKKTSSSPAMLEQQQAYGLAGAAGTAASSRAASTASDDDSCPPSAPEKSGSGSAATSNADATAALPDTRYLELMPPVVLDLLSDAEISMPDTPTTPVSWGVRSGPVVRPEELQSFADARPGLTDATPAVAAAAAGTAATAAACGAASGDAAAAGGSPPAVVEAAAAADSAPAAPRDLEAHDMPQATPEAATALPAAAAVLPQALTEPAGAAAAAAAAAAGTATAAGAAAATADQRLPLLPAIDFIPAPAEESAAVIQHELQQLQLLRPQLGSQLLRLALLQTLFCATNATSTVRLYMQHCAQALQQQQQQQQPGSSSHPEQQVSAELQTVQDFVARQLQLLTFRLRRHHQRQQHQQHGASLALLSLLVCMCQLQSALREWRQAAEQQLLDCTAMQRQVGLSCILSSRGSGSEGSGVLLAAAAAVLLGCGAALMLPVVLQAAARGGALLLVALWLGWLLLSRAGVGAASSVDARSVDASSSSLQGTLGLQPAGGRAAAGHAVQQQQQQGLPTLLVLQDLRDSRVASTCVATQACATSSTVGRTAWPVQLAAADDDAAAAGCQQGLLHTLPEDRYLNGWKLREQQQDIAAGSPQAAHASGAPGAVAGELLLVELSQHRLLAGPVLSSAKRPADAAFLHRLQQLASERQQLFTPVLWVCQEPPMLLEAGQPGLLTLASWLQQQQHAGAVSSSSSSSSAGVWRAPFPAGAWPQVLGWLLQVAAALAALHASQLVHGGVSAAAVHLAADDGSSSSTDDGTSGKTQQQQPQLRACLSLASPWQHAVTPGRVADAALAAPEVLAGASPTGSPSADVYGLGLLMWQLATGWLPQPQPHLRCDDRAGGGGGSRGRGCAGLRDELQLYDELAWCGEMVRLFGTTFPGAAGAGFERRSSAAAAAAAAAAGGSGQVMPATAAGLLGGTEEEEDEEASELLILSDAEFAARHGVLPGGEGVDYADEAAAAVRAWLPAGYRRLMHDCCRSDLARRLDMQQLQDRLRQVAAGATGW